MTAPERFHIGVACLIRSGPFLVLEVQKSHKWSRTPEGVRVGIGCIGGALEPGESPVEALQRECREEIGCDVRIRPAAQTWLCTRAEPARQVGWTEDGPRPALIWEGEGIPGGVVPVYLGEAAGEVSPADLPALLLAPPALVRELLRGPHTFGAYLQAGGQAREREAIPPEAVLELRGTLAALQAMGSANPGLLDGMLGSV